MFEIINKFTFIGLIIVYSIGTTPTIATEDVTEVDAKKTSSTLISIRDITPIKNSMNKEEAEKAIHDFFQTEVLIEENELYSEDIARQEFVRSNAIGRSFELITMKDGTQWVPAFDGLQRFLGALYLKKAIEHHNINDFRVVETKFMMKNLEEDIVISVKKLLDEPLKNIYTINSNNFISLSRYVGDEKLTLDYNCNLINLRYLTGFMDFAGNANLRILKGDNKVTVIDTEYRSFSSDVLEWSQEVESDIGGTKFTFSINS
ncbi:MAG: hypothetical protein BGO76_03455 [Caedibacter sp. 38-128]|nr:hypothetical protein [Holosporales bacterium]OJX07922.1 MAG: hypothetical protein BGO76_03455 [Caedibacter sp. 38-128]